MQLSETLTIKVEGYKDTYIHATSLILNSEMSQVPAYLVRFGAKERLDEAELIGTKITVDYKVPVHEEDPVTRNFVGVITKVTSLERGYDGASEHYSYEVEFMPKIFAALKYNTKTRVFAKQSFVKIIKAIFTDHGLGEGGDFSIKTKLPVDQQKKIEFVIQDGETDLVFFMRLVEAAGLMWMFDEENKLLITDDATQYLKFSEEYLKTPSYLGDYVPKEWVHGSYGHRSISENKNPFITKKFLTGFWNLRRQVSATPLQANVIGISTDNFAQSAKGETPKAADAKKFSKDTNFGTTQVIVDRAITSKFSQEESDRIRQTWHPETFLVDAPFGSYLPGYTVAMTEEFKKQYKKQQYNAQNAHEFEESFSFAKSYVIKSVSTKFSFSLGIYFSTLELVPVNEKSGLVLPSYNLLNLPISHRKARVSDAEGKTAAQKPAKRVFADADKRKIFAVLEGDGNQATVEIDWVGAPGISSTPYVGNILEDVFAANWQSPPSASRIRYDNSVPHKAAESTIVIGQETPGGENLNKITLTDNTQKPEASKFELVAQANLLIQALLGKEGADFQINAAKDGNKTTVDFTHAGFNINSSVANGKQVVQIKFKDDKQQLHAIELSDQGIIQSTDKDMTFSANGKLRLKADEIILDAQAIRGVAEKILELWGAQAKMTGAKKVEVTGAMLEGRTSSPANFKMGPAEVKPVLPKAPTMKK
jgi:hypothetical protein